MQVKLYLRPNTAPRPCAHLQTRVEVSRHCATVYLERRQYFVRANEWPCRWLDGGGCALGISGNKGQTGSVDCRGCVHTLPRITGRTRHRGINIHFGEMRAPDDVRWCMLRPPPPKVRPSRSYSLYTPVNRPTSFLPWSKPAWGRITNVPINRLYRNRISF